MHAMISDFDGIMVETERAKALGWYAAVKRLKCELADQEIVNLCALKTPGRTLAESIGAELKSASVAVLPGAAEDRSRLIGDKLSRLSPAEMDAIRSRSGIELAVWCAGGTTAQFRNNIWDVFLANAQGFQNLSDDQRDAKLQELEDTRTTLKRPFMILAAEPLEDNQRFFSAVLDTLGTTRLALVNQSKSADMYDLFCENRLWRAAPCLPHAFGEYVKGRGFPRAICVGDKLSGVSDKQAAYRRACSMLDIDPAETMTFEDTATGIAAARGARIGIIVGVRLPDSLQDMSEADYIVDGSLACMTPIIERLPSKSVSDIRTELDGLSCGNIMTGATDAKT